MSDSNAVPLRAPIQAHILKILNILKVFSIDLHTDTVHALGRWRY